MSAYLIADIKVTDDAWVPAYAASVHELVARHGGRYLSRSGNVKTMEGYPLDTTLIAVIEFPDGRRRRLRRRPGLRAFPRRPQGGQRKPLPADRRHRPRRDHSLSDARLSAGPRRRGRRAAASGIPHQGCERLGPLHELHLRAWRRNPKGNRRHERGRALRFRAIRRRLTSIRRRAIGRRGAGCWREPASAVAGRAPGSGNRSAARPVNAAFTLRDESSSVFSGRRRMSGKEEERPGFSEEAMRGLYDLELRVPPPESYGD